MGLPQVNASKYEATIPSTGQKIEFRPFLVKEEKLLMVALESKDNKLIVRTMKDVLNSCIYTDVDINAFTTFDLEELFLRLRSKSVGEKVELKLKCEECDYENPQTVNLDELSIEINKEKNNVIMINDEVGIEFKYPSLTDLENLDSADGKDTKEQLKVMSHLIIKSIKSIFDNDNVYPAVDQTDEELENFIDTLNSGQFKEITDWISNMPGLVHNIEYKCNKCGHENSLELRGLQSFFT